MHRIFSIVLLSIALTQLYGISDKVIHAFWMWYKFKGYSNDCHSTIDLKVAIFTYLISVLTIITCNYLYKKPTGKFTKLTIKYSSYSLAWGIILLTVLLISPLGKIV